MEKNSVMGSPIEIVDSVISMTKNELVTNLGTIVQTSTKSLMDAMAACGDFPCVGSLLRILLGAPRANKLRFASKHSGEARHKCDMLFEGGPFAFLKERRLKDIVKKHSVMGFPVELSVKNSKEKEVTDSEEEDEEKTEEDEDAGDGPKIDVVDKGKEMKRRRKRPGRLRRRRTNS